jgi:hypothetical protein
MTYKVLKDWDVPAEIQALWGYAAHYNAGDIVGLADDLAAPLVADGTLELLSQENTSISGEGTTTEAGVQSVGEEVGPFRVTISWKARSTEADIVAAQAFVTELVNDVNANVREIPEVIESILISKRI